MADYKSTLFAEMISDFAENEVKPLAQEIDEEERFPLETVEKMAKLGLMGIIVPKEYGGAGGNYPMYISAVEELSKHCGTTGVVLSAHTSLCAAPILEYGTEDQKRKYLPDLASGRKIGAFGLTEPNAGTDASNQQTVAVEMEDHYLLNGSKIFITNAGYASVYIIIAVTGKGPKGPEMSAFIVESAFDGFSVGKKEKKMGIRGSSTCELIFENVKVPKENLLGKRGDGFKIAMKTLDGGRIGIAAQALGIIVDLDWALATLNMSDEFTPYGAGDGTIKNIKCPVALTMGEKDIVVPDYMVLDNYNALGELATLLPYENCGHSPMVDCPDRLAKDVVEFFEK